MQIVEKLIINTEFFLQCHGSCSGCFLTNEERNSSNTYYDSVRNGLIKISEEFSDKEIEFLVIGFGRGNTLNLGIDGINKLLNLIELSKQIFNFQRITFEISTSLIGKLDKQLEISKLIVDKEERAYFNIVLNSEVTSSSFWSNVNEYHQNMSSYRKEKYKLNDEYSDILVLNINPEKLPLIEDIVSFTKDYGSPVNISIFPFDVNAQITNEKLVLVNEWSKKLWFALKDKDLNIKNFLFNFNQINIGSNIEDIIEYNNKTISSYYFVDKNSVISNGSLSIMGEVDKLRLLDKYNINLSLEDGYKAMVKERYCRTCEYQKECLLSGAYLNLLANKNRFKLNKINSCLSGYQDIFKECK